MNQPFRHVSKWIYSSVTAKGAVSSLCIFAGALFVFFCRSAIAIVMFFPTAFLHLMVSLSSYAKVSAEFTLALRPLLDLREMRRGTLLVEKGKRQQVVWFLHLGTAKEVTVDEVSMEGRVSWFWYPSDFLFSYPGFFAQEPAIASIELVEDSVLLEISYADFMEVRDSYAEVPLLVEKIRAHYEKMRVGHAADLVNLNARERYQKFFAAHKGLFNVARHKDIASFLGIKDDGFHRYQ